MTTDSITGSNSSPVAMEEAIMIVLLMLFLSSDGCHYLCDVKIVTIDIEVEVKTVSFSKLMWLLYYHNNV